MRDFRIIETEIVLSKRAEYGYTLTVGKEEKSIQQRDFRKQTEDASLHQALRKMVLEPDCGTSAVRERPLQQRGLAYPVRARKRWYRVQCVLSADVFFSSE